MYYYQDHVVYNIYAREEKLTDSELECPICYQKDSFLGEYDSKEEFFKEYPELVGSKVLYNMRF